MIAVVATGALACAGSALAGLPSSRVDATSAETGVTLFSNGRYATLAGEKGSLMPAPGYVDREENDSAADRPAASALDDGLLCVLDGGICGFPCPSYGLLMNWASGASAHADLRGSLGVTARADVDVSGCSSSATASGGGNVDTRAGAVVNDTVTLSRAATVTLRGHLSAVLSDGARPDAYEDGWPRPLTLSAQVGFLHPGIEGSLTLDGWHNSYSIDHPDPPYGLTCDPPLTGLCAQRPVADNFETQIELPEGTSSFTAVLQAETLVQGYADVRYGYGDPTSSGQSGNVDADTLTFEIVVPDDVVASSGSGLLPIVGGQQQTDDTTPPIVAAPTDVRATNGAGICAASVNPGTAIASDENPGVTVEGVRSDGLALDAAYPVGTTTVAWTATDAAGNTASATQRVTVADTEPPAVTAPPNVSVANDTGRADASVDPGTATAADNCPGVTVAGSRSDGATLSEPYPVGTTTIAWTATDAAGNAASATQSIDVRDVEAPVLSLPAGLTADADGPSGATITYTVGAADNVGVVSQSCSPATGSTFAIGDTTVHCTASDAAGNSVLGDFVVHVQLRGAAELLDALTGALPLGSLQTKAQAARSSAAAGKTKTACNQLDALLHEVDALDGKKLAHADAGAIRDAVGQIRSVLGC
jgi:hypothetical protein